MAHSKLDRCFHWSSGRTNFSEKLNLSGLNNDANFFIALQFTTETLKSNVLVTPHPAFSSLVLFVQAEPT